MIRGIYIAASGMLAESLRADVTANNDDDKELLARFKLFGPPGIIFFDTRGQEISGQRVVGYQDAERFSATLRQVL